MRSRTYGPEYRFTGYPKPREGLHRGKGYCPRSERVSKVSWYVFIIHLPTVINSKTAAALHCGAIYTR